MGDLPPVTVSEVATTEEECGLDIYQDPTKPDCNRTIHQNQDNDHKTSYVAVTESNGIDDDAAVDKNALFWAPDGCPELDTMVDDQAANGEPQKVVENQNVEWDDDDEFPPLVSRATTRQESSPEDGHGHNGRRNKSWSDVVAKNLNKHSHVEVKPGIRSFSGSSRVKVSNSFNVKNGGAPNIVLKTGDLPVLLPSYSQDRVEMVSKPADFGPELQIPRMELQQETTVEYATSDDQMQKKVSKRENQNLANKGSTELVLKNGFVVLSGVDGIDEVQQDEAEKSAKEAAENESKEQANETPERKKRQAKKVQLRAQLKAYKEAEQIEKEREKRLRRKERKKAAARDINNDRGTAASSYSGAGIIETSTNQSKTKFAPPPLRNRNKNLHWPTMLVGLICIVMFALLWFRDIGVFSKVKLNYYLKG